MTSAVKIATLAAAVAAAATAVVSWRASERETAAERTYPPIGEIVMVGDTPVHAYVAGSGQDLVILHGAGGNLRDYVTSILPSLARKYRVIALDRPGHGYTGHPPDAARTLGETPVEQAKLLRAAADQLKVEKPIVLGHSFGGAVAMAWALEEPSDTAALVVVSGVSMPWPGKLKTSYKINSSRLGGAVVVPLITAFAPKSVTDGALDGIFAPQSPPDNYADKLGLALTLRRNTMKSNARQVYFLRPHVVAMSKRYHTLTMPIELVHGDADTIVPMTVHAGPLSEQLSNADLTVLQGIGHMPIHTNPDDVLAAVERAAIRAGLH